MYEIDRKTASKMLKMTMRTVDRYVKSGKLSSEVRDGRVWLDKKEILKLRHGKIVDSDSTIISKKSIDNGGVSDKGDSGEAVHVVSTPLEERGNFESGQTAPYRPAKEEERVYKKLFEELREELKIKQDRLEGANYRVGQLEAMVKDSIPLLEHQKMLLAERSQLQEIKQSFDPLRIQNAQLESSLKDEKTNKRVYLIILFIIMLLQPLWLILSLKN